MSYRILHLSLGLLAALSVSVVNAHTASKAADINITHEVERLISRHAELGTQLSVQTENGVVYIGGTPAERFGLSNLELVLRNTEGVRNIVITAVYPEN